MRETNLRNTAHIFGLVVYTGNDTKIQQSNNSGEKAKVKVSRIFHMVNKIMLMMFLTQFTLCVLGGVLAGFAMAEDQATPVWYFAFDLASANPVWLECLLRTFTWVQILSQMVPISLIMTAEMVKYLQGRMIQYDRTLYHAPIDKRAKVNRSTIHEDLGLIDYIFTDKTGTLTQNKMEFRYFKVGTGEFGSKETEIARSVKRRREVLLSLSSLFDSSLSLFLFFLSLSRTLLLLLLYLNRSWSGRLMAPSLRTACGRI
jgi:magnesium-transporting ATPase (P-type)